MNSRINGVSGTNPTFPGNGASRPPLQPLYGYRNFSGSQNGNLQANTFLNTVLNSGSGMIGTVAAARNLSEQGPRLSSSSNGSSFQMNGATAPFGFNTPRGGQLPGMANLMLTGRPVGLHQPAPRIVQLEGQRPRIYRESPTPASGLIILADIDTPIRSPGPPARPFRSSCSSPASSMSSMSSFGSAPSGPCECPNCSGCLCHLYCEHHAEQRCPVHGQGLSSSGESGINGSQSSINSSLSGSSPNGRRIGLGEPCPLA